MSVTYGFFNSLNGDRTYNADQMSEYFEGLISNGVCQNYGGGMQVLAGSGMQVAVQTGRAYIDSKWIKLDAVENVTINQSHLTLNRYTAVCVKLDNTNRQMELVTIDGDPGTDPVKPTPNNSGSSKYLVIAYVYVPANVSAIQQQNITDTRMNTSLCGFVSGLIDQVDTTTLFLQWEAAYDAAMADMTNWQTQMKSEFDAWFSTLTEELGINTYVDRYTKTVELSTGSSTTIPLDMEGYTYGDTDMIDVYINGLIGAMGEDYTISVTGTTARVIPTAKAIGTEVTINAVKSRIGFQTN